MAGTLVIGATGDQGHPLMRQMLGARITPVAALRNPDAFKGTEFADIESVQADIYDTASLNAAAQGMDAMAVNLLFVFDVEKARTLGANIAAAARKNGLRKIVFNTSCYVHHEDNGNPAHDGRREIEREIAECGVDYAIFEPMVFMDNMIRSWSKPSIVNNGIFAYPAKPGLKISWICLDDVAAYMVEALQRDDLANGRYAIGGPEALVGDEVAEHLGSAAQKQVSFKSLTPDKFASNMSLLVSGSAEVQPHSIYDGMASFYRFYNEQPSSPLIADNAKIDAIFQYKPTSLLDWARKQDWTDPVDPALALRMAGQTQ